MATLPVPQPGNSVLNLVIEILQEAAGIAGAFLGPAGGADIAIGAALLRIFQKARSAYEQHVGQPIDEASIQPIDPVH